MKSKKTKLLKSFLLLLPFYVVLLGAGCEKEDSISVISDDIGNLLSVFELKYGDSKEIIYNGEKVELSIKNIVDSVTIDCSLADFSNNQDAPLTLRIYSYLQINSQDKIVRVSSKPCGALLYEDNGHDVQDVNDLIRDLESAPANLKDSSYFADAFINLFGEGLFIENTSFRIFIAKAFPTNFSHPNAGIEDYRFVFIVTTKK
ncbi:MAG: hypothetical protein AB7S72_10605 [Draconibacterium sp.]